MNRLKEKIKKKWKVMTGLTVMFMLVFLVGFAVKAHFTTKAAGADEYTIQDSEGNIIIGQGSTSGSFSMKRGLDSLSAIRGLSSASDNITYNWHIPDTKTISFDNDSTDSTGAPLTNGSGNQVGLKVISTGTVSVTLTVTNNTTNVLQTFTIKVTVVFSISEYFDNSVTTAKFAVPCETEKNTALIMDYDAEIEFGKDSKTDTSKLNMIFGDATDELAVWSSDNSDVVEVKKEGKKNKSIRATGPGRTKLKVSYTVGLVKFNAEIAVYVRPTKITYSMKSNPTMDEEIDVSNTTNQASIPNGAYIDIKSNSINNPLEKINDKVVWVISKTKKGQSVLVSDSLGNKSDEYGDDARLEPVLGGTKYQLHAKAGIYNILFYVKGTYTSFDDVKEHQPKCELVNVAGGVQVSSNYEPKIRTINIGGNYNLSDAFNISLRDLDDLDIDFVKDDKNNNIDYHEYIDVNTTDWIVKAKKVGTTEFKVVPKPGHAGTSNIPGFNQISLHGQHLTQIIPI